MSKVYVIGGEQTDFERNWTKEGKSVLAMFKEVIEGRIKSYKTFHIMI
jgi:acetyl-CoA C-acetyltransferase